MSILRDSRGQAMLEYVLLSTMVVIVGISAYSWTGWFQGIQGYMHDLLLNVALPIP